MSKTETTTYTSGKNRAVLIGINYTGTSNQLNGCINDVENFYKYLKERFAHVNEVRLSSTDTHRESSDEGDDICGCSCLPSLSSLCKKEKQTSRRDLSNINMADSTLDVLILTDNQTGLHYPSKKNILNAFHWLTKGATSDSHLALTYSGHGSHQRDYSRDEEDGQDESIVPADFQKSGMIIDDEIRRVLIDPLPEGCQLRVIMDCCHSATSCDLRYGYRALDFTCQTNSRQTETKCDVISWSGCLDSQTSADAWIDRKFAGALTANFLKIMRDPDQDKSYRAVYAKVHERLKADGYSQRPQLSSGKEIDLNATFDLF